MKAANDDSAREIHHRVKNNLQIIASILRLQMRRSGSIEAQKELAGAVHRILGMVEVHDLLAHAEADTVEIGELLRRLLALHTQAFLMPGQAVRSSVTGPTIRLPAARALALALAASELVVNAFKHAFAGRPKGTLEVTLAREPGHVSLVVEDDGAGLPEDFSIAAGANLGLRLVRSVVEQDLGGALEVARRRKGTRVLLRLPERA